MKFRIVVIAAALLLMGGVPAAQAQIATAMVEDISSDRADVQMMDYLVPGQVIDLSAGEQMSVGYFASCVLERIVGGSVTIGERKSVITGGEVSIDYVDCDDRVLVLASGQQQDAGTTAVRAGQPCSSLVPDVVVYDVSPLVQLAEEASSLDYAACDAAAANDWQTLAADHRLADFRAAGIVLEKGQKYILRRGDASIVVLISRQAEANNPALIGRLVPL